MLESLLIALAILVTPFIERAIRHADETKAREQFLQAVLEAINLVTVNLGHLTFPTEFTLHTDSTPLPATIELTVNSRSLPTPTFAETTADPMPPDVLAYCDGWSAKWAQDAAKQRAYRLRTELGSWDLAFAYLQKEDGAVNG